MQDYRPRDAHPAPPVLNHQRDTNSQIASSRQRTYPLSDYVTHNCPGPAPALWRTLGVGLIFGTLFYIKHFGHNYEHAVHTFCDAMPWLGTLHHGVYLLELVFRKKKKNHWPSMMRY